VLLRQSISGGFRVGGEHQADAFQFINLEEAERWYKEMLDLDTCKLDASLVNVCTVRHCSAVLFTLANDQGVSFSIVTQSLLSTSTDQIPDQPTLKMYGRTFPQSRQIAAYSTVPDATLKYSGSTITMNYPFPPVLERIRKKLELELGVAFNHVMLNRYDDGSVYIGYVRYRCHLYFR
jgi:hypothetical protein